MHTISCHYCFLKTKSINVVEFKDNLVMNYGGVTCNFKIMAIFIIFKAYYPKIYELFYYLKSILGIRI